MADDPQPVRARTIVIPARGTAITIPAKVRSVIARENMALYEVDPQRPDESPIYSINIAKELAKHPGDAIVNVTPIIGLFSGADPAADTKLLGPVGIAGTELSQRVADTLLHGNVYYLKFMVITTLQKLTFIILIPVSNDGVA